MTEKQQSGRQKELSKEMKRGRATGAAGSSRLPRSKWIDSMEEHEDHPGQSLATRNHEVIKHWAEERRAEPAAVAGTEHEGRAGVLRLDFPGYGTVPKISWDDWFKTFDDRELIFLYQEHLKNGNTSNFFKLNSPSREHE